MNPVPYDLDNMTVAQLKDCAQALVRLWRLQIMNNAPPIKIARTLEIVREELASKWDGKSIEPVTKTFAGCHPTPWVIGRTEFGESMGVNSKSSIFDADGRHVVTIGNGTDKQVYAAEAIAEILVSAINGAAT